MKSVITMIGLFSLAVVHSANGNLIISGVTDGTQSGGNPKAIELVALQNIADISIYSVIRDTNGAGPFDTAVALPAVSLNAGEFFYIAGNTATETFFNNSGFSVGLVNGTVANINGDDILGVGLNAVDPLTNVVDSFGQPGQGDTNFYTDSFAIRNAGTAPNSSGVVDAGNFTITGYSDGGLTGPNGFGSYVVGVIPEPSSVLLLGLGLMGVLRLRRK